MVTRTGISDTPQAETSRRASSKVMPFPRANPMSSAYFPYGEQQKSTGQFLCVLLGSGYNLNPCQFFRGELNPCHSLLLCNPILKWGYKIFRVIFTPIGFPYNHSSEKILPASFHQSRSVLPFVLCTYHSFQLFLRSAKLFLPNVSLFV